MNNLELSAARLWMGRARLALAPARRRSLFILSHMRSYSSLLCHILNSNPEVAGYVELHQSYRGRMDLLDLQIMVARTTGDRLTGRYVLDKVLHNNADIHARILRREDVYTVFSIREPEQTIRSTIAMVRRKGGPAQNWKHNPTKVARYYVRRVDRLVELAAMKPRRSLFFDADRLVDDSDTVLDGLTRFLGLAEPLTSRYETFNLTGEPGYGDPGKFITTGEIVRERTDYTDIEIPDDDLARAREAYERTTAALMERCEVVVGKAKDLGSDSVSSPR